MAHHDTEMSPSFRIMIDTDLELLWRIQDFCYSRPSLDMWLAGIVSKYPWKDVCCIVWIFFAIGCFELKTKHFFVVMMNLVACFSLRRLVAAKRPVEYDARLKPLTDLSAESYGFPSMESYMSVVVMIHLYISFKSKLFLPVALFVIFMVGFSRVYSRARFPHQVAGSWLLGLLGLYASMHCCNHMEFHNMSHFVHGKCVAVVVILIVINFASAMESNDSRIAYIPKEEFVRVLRNIIYSSEKSVSDGSASVGRGEDTPRQRARIRLAEISNDGLRRGGQVKRDSFFFLQQTLERRQVEVRAARVAVEKGERVDMDSFRSASFSPRDDNINKFT